MPGGALLWSGLAVVLAARADRLGAVRAAAGALVVAAMLGGYLAVHVITPAPLSWHIATSFERLVVQLWPAAVWAAFQPSASVSGIARRPSGSSTALRWARSCRLFSASVTPI